MKKHTYSHARKNMKIIMDDVCASHEPATITRQRGGDVVLLSLNHYEELVLPQLKNE